MNADEFTKTLDTDLLEKWRDQLNDPMLRRALQTIMDVRRSNKQLLAARAKNNAIQAKRIGS